MTAEWSVQARWLFPVDGPPIENGVVTMIGDKIVAVEPPGVRTPDLDLGNVAMLPGLVNAHTHLDLGELRGTLAPQGEFTEWLRAVVAYRRASTPANWEASIRAGITESLGCGTTLIGDISTGGLSYDLLADSPLRALAFHELIGLTAARAGQSEKDARAWLATRTSTARTRLGLSPHAPYSVRKSLFSAAAAVAGQRQTLLATHLGETREEVPLLQSHAGPFRDFLAEIGAWNEDGLAPDRAWILDQYANTHALYIHANYLLPELWNRLAGASVIYCPRTHAYFRHDPHPYRRMLAAGVNVALGTDSLASNPDLSILEEMRFLWRRDHSAIAGETLLRLGTLHGAAALGWEKETGSLTPGKSADWITVPLPGEEAADPHDLLFGDTPAVRDVVIHGRWVIRNHERIQATT